MSVALEVVFYLAVFGFVTLGFTAFGLAVVFGFAVTAVDVLGAAAILATGAAGTSATFVAIAGVVSGLHADLQQYLPRHLFNKQPSNMPATNHQKQYPNELNRALMITPKKDDQKFKNWQHGWNLIESLSASFTATSSA